METHSLISLNAYVRRAVRLNFPEAIWIQAEVAQVSLSKGHYFLELIEKDSDADSIIAQASAVCWKNMAARIGKTLGKAMLDQLLQDGRQLLLKVEVELHERFGYQLLIQEIDPSYTIGQLALQRQETLKRLAEEERLDKNGSIPLRPVLQRIAVLSSERAAGLQDFVTHLQQNPFGYQFWLDHYPISVQGKNVAAELNQQLRIIEFNQGKYDAAVIIRGGGSRIDSGGI